MMFIISYISFVLLYFKINQILSFIILFSFRSKFFFLLFLAKIMDLYLSIFFCYFWLTSSIPSEISVEVSNITQVCNGTAYLSSGESKKKEMERLFSRNRIEMLK